MPGQTSFYYAIFKKLQATGRSLNVHVNPDSDPNGNFGGFSLESPENLHGIFGGLGDGAAEAGRQVGDKPLAGGSDPNNVPLYRILKQALPATSLALQDTVNVNGEVWWTMPYPLQGSLAGCPIWKEFNQVGGDALVKAVGTWIGAGAPNDSPKAPFDFASLKLPPLPKFGFKPGNKPGESSPILFVASYPNDNGRRPGDGEMPDPPAIPGNFWDTSQIALTNEAGVPQPDGAKLQAGTERYVRAVIGNAGSQGAGRMFNGQPHIEVKAFALVSNSFMGPGVALPSLSNLDPADPNPVYEEYRMQILERDVVGFRFNVDAVFKGLKDAMAGFTPAQLGGVPLDEWLKVGHACVKVLITKGEVTNNYTPQGAVPTLGSNPAKDRHIAQHNLGQFDMTVMGAKKIQWQNFIMAQAGTGTNALSLKHALPAGAADFYIAVPTQTFGRFIAKGGSYRGFEQVKAPPSKPFPDAVILHATGAEAQLVAGDHVKEPFLALSLGMAGDPAKLKGVRAPSVAVAHAAHDGTVVGGFTIRVVTPR